MPSSNFEVLYFVDSKEHVPVRDYVMNLTETERAKVYAYLKHLGDVGYKMRRPFADYLGSKTGLYELRPGRHRMIYFFFIKNKIILLHAFLKKTDTIPEKEIKIALDRKETCQVLVKFNRVDFEL